MQRHWQCICFALLAVESENSWQETQRSVRLVLHRDDLLCRLIIKRMTSLINISNAKVITSAPAINFHYLKPEKVGSVAQRRANDTEVHSESTRLAKRLPTSRYLWRKSEKWLMPSHLNKIIFFSSDFFLPPEINKQTKKLLTIAGRPFFGCSCARAFIYICTRNCFRQ